MFELEDRHETMPISFNANEIFLSEKYLKKKQYNFAESWFRTKKS